MISQILKLFSLKRSLITFIFCTFVAVSLLLRFYNYRVAEFNAACLGYVMSFWAVSASYRLINRGYDL